MSALQYCDLCEVAITKNERAFHSRDGKILCEVCHEKIVQETKEKAKRHLEAKAGARPKDRTVLINVAIGAVVVAAIGLFAYLMSTRTDDPAAQAESQAPAAAPK